MRVENATGTNQLFTTIQFGRNKQDGQIKSIKNQLITIQEQLQQLSENEDMSAKQKLEKREELEQQMKDLNKQLMERQMELQKEKTEKKDEIEKHLPKTKNEENQPNASMETSTLQGILKAGSAMSQIKTTGSLRTNMKNRARICESEISLDKLRGMTPSEYTKEELSNLNRKVESITNHLSKQMSDINHMLKETNESTNKVTDNQKDNMETEKMEQTEILEHDNESAPKNNNTPSQYNTVDIRL